MGERCSVTTLTYPCTPNQYSKERVESGKGSEWQGKEMRNLGSFRLSTLTATLKNSAPSERPPFGNALNWTQPLVDPQFVAQYLSQTETTLSYMPSYFPKFEKYMDMFPNFRITKLGKPRARRVNQVL